MKRSSAWSSTVMINALSISSGSEPCSAADGKCGSPVRAASYLGVSGQYVRSLLAEGSRYQRRLDEAADGEVVAEPSAHLIGVLRRLSGGW